MSYQSMRKLRDETLVRNILLRSSSEDFSKPFTDDSFERALQDSICLRERAIRDFEEHVEYLRHTVTMLVDTHFKFSKDKRAFVRRIYSKARKKQLKSGGADLHSWFVGQQIRLLDQYLESKSETNSEEESITPTAYLEKVRKSCAERKPWLPRPVFDAALLDAATVDREAEEW